MKINIDFIIFMIAYTFLILYIGEIIGMIKFMIFYSNELKMQELILKFNPCI